MRLKGGLYFNFDVRVFKNFSFQDCLFDNIKSLHKGAVQGEVKVKEKSKRQILQRRRYVLKNHAKIDLAK